MSVDYQKLYAYLVGKIDDALELLESGDLVKRGPSGNCCRMPCCGRKIVILKA